MPTYNSTSFGRSFVEESLKRSKSKMNMVANTISGKNITSASQKISDALKSHKESNTLSRFDPFKETSSDKFKAEIDEISGKRELTQIDKEMINYFNEQSYMSRLLTLFSEILLTIESLKR
jgi:hypothetical protein